jgi:hypothetical protein
MKQSGIEAGGGERGHVQGAAHVGTTAFDVTDAYCFADVAGDGGEAGEHGDFFGREGAQFLQTGDDRDGGRLAETGVAVCIAICIIISTID